MRINLTINNVNVTLESNNNNELMNLLDKIMVMDRPAPSIQNNIREEFKAHVAPIIPTQQTFRPAPQFIPASDKQKQLLKAIPEFKGRDLNSVSKSEASRAIENWNKSRSYHYKDHY